MRFNDVTNCRLPNKAALLLCVDIMELINVMFISRQLMSHKTLANELTHHKANNVPEVSIISIKSKNEGPLQNMLNSPTDGTSAGGLPGLSA